jgi:hypothetical protein
VRAEDLERLTAEQGVVQMGAEVGREVALLARGDDELAARIMREVMAAWDRGIAQGRARRAARAAEAEPVDLDAPGTFVVRPIGPAEIEARRW